MRLDEAFDPGGQNPHDEGEPRPIRELEEITELDAIAWNLPRRPKRGLSSLDAADDIAVGKEHRRIS
jgi:hypothetical protein